MLKGRSEACPASSAGCGYTSELSTVAQRNHCDYYLAMLHHSTWSSEDKPLYSPASPQEKTERSSITHATSQAKEQANNLMVDVSSHESWTIIQSCLNDHLCRWIRSMCIEFSSDAHWNKAHSCEHNWSRSNMHLMCIEVPMPMSKYTLNNQLLHDLVVYKRKCGTKQ